jgi:hypothetical protein
MRKAFSLYVGFQILQHQAELSADALEVRPASFIIRPGIESRFGNDDPRAVNFFL